MSTSFLEVASGPSRPLDDLVLRRLHFQSFARGVAARPEAGANARRAGKVKNWFRLSIRFYRLG
jgi:hypothetical protein